MSRSNHVQSHNEIEPDCTCQNLIWFYLIVIGRLHACRISLSLKKICFFEDGEQAAQYVAIGIPFVLNMQQI